jgi:predicted dinucleotide-binding enzyme
MTHSIIGVGALGKALTSQFVRFKIPVQITRNSHCAAIHGARNGPLRPCGVGA